MKLLTIVGTRPNFIKLAPLDRELRKDHTCITVHTGQHFDDSMYESFFREFGIAHPKYNLNISNVSGASTHATQTGQILEHCERVLMKEQPDMAIVYGDTNSSMAGALAAAKLNIPIAHIEAGCRSFDKTMPEEVNRVIIDSISTLLFAPTYSSSEILRRIRGVGGLHGTVYYSGDVMADVLDENLMKARDESTILQQLKLLDGARYAVLTLHRPSNVDNKGRVQKILSKITESGVNTIFPVHPRTKKLINAAQVCNNIEFIQPLPYRDMLRLMDGASVIVTDSGGIQKEAFMLKKPCLTIRNNTEWPETFACGWNRLVKDLDTLPELIRKATPPQVRPVPEPFPIGASRMIAKVITMWGQR